MKKIFLPASVAGIASAVCLFGASVAYAAPALSQSSVTLGLGQSVTVSSQASTTAVYWSANTNPSIAALQANGTPQITAIGNQTGSTVATICYVNTASDCASLTITVQSGSVLSFSQNNLTLTAGQNASVTVSGGGGTYSISTNSNTSAVSTTLSGNTITLSALATGIANITVCDQSNNCGTLSATVGNSGPSGSGSLSFSNANPSIAVGQVFSVTVSGGSGYYVTANTNSNVASQSMSSNVLAISGLATGSTTLTVCSTTNGCNYLYVTVGSGTTTTTTATTTTNQAVAFGVANPSMVVGQSMTVSLSGSSGYFISSHPNTSIVQASVSNNAILLYGLSAGSAQITVCASVGGCGTLSVTVTGSTGTTTTATQTTTQTTTQTAAQTATNNSTILATIQSIQSQLTQLLLQIQSMANTLTQLASIVAGSAQTNAVGVTGSGSYAFTQALGVGSQGAEVTALQKRLTALGFYSGSATGYYGALTEAAVKRLQTAHSIEAKGNVGPATRVILNGQ